MEYEIVEVKIEPPTFLIKYTYEEGDQFLNLPLPLKDQDPSKPLHDQELEDYILSFAPGYNPPPIIEGLSEETKEYLLSLNPPDAGKEDSGGGFESLTRLIFQQSSAPKGWTKITTHNNTSLRVTSENVSSGGTLDFTEIFKDDFIISGNITISGMTVGATTLSVSQIPSHTHSGGTSRMSGGSNTSYTHGQCNIISTGSSGGGGSHTHPISGGTGIASLNNINLGIKYIDVILAEKD